MASLYLCQWKGKHTDLLFANKSLPQKHSVECLRPWTRINVLIFSLWKDYFQGMLSRPNYIRIGLLFLKSSQMSQKCLRKVKIRFQNQLWWCCLNMCLFVSGHCWAHNLTHFSSMRRSSRIFYSEIQHSRQKECSKKATYLHTGLVFVLLKSRYNFNLPIHFCVQIFLWQMPCNYSNTAYLHCQQPEYIFLVTIPRIS